MKRNILPYAKLNPNLNTFPNQNIPVRLTVACSLFAKFLVILFLLCTPLFLHAQDVLVGLTSNGGPQGKGTAFTINNTGAGFSIIKSFADWGKNPNGNLIRAIDGSFYGLTNSGGTHNQGTIFKVTTAGLVTVLHHFNSLTDGANPLGSLVQASDGNFYGLTNAGGTNTYGTLFRITPGGTFTVLRHFGFANDGDNPRGHLVIGTDGHFYGITSRGGANGEGTIFRYTLTGTYSVLRSFNRATDGGNSFGSLVKGTDGNFYGTTSGGGNFGAGTLFCISSTGSFTVIRHLTASTDGSSPKSSLIQGSDGNLYGTASTGGTNGRGTIFRINVTGTSFIVLRHLNFLTDGANPLGSLAQGTDSNLYGMTSAGGLNQNGTIFKISTGGTFTLLRSLATATDGGVPKGGLVRSSDSNFYGLTSDGGSNLYGTIFKINASGTFTILNRLNGGIQGNAPFETLVQGTDNAYYGTTSTGGTFN